MRCRSMPTRMHWCSAGKNFAMPYSATPFDLSGQIALVTGAYRGLGFAMARGLARAGAKPKELASAVKRLTDAELVADLAVFDVTDSEAVRSGIEQIAVKHGPV